MTGPPPSDPEDLLAGVREFVSESVLPNVVDWDRDDRVPAVALQTMLDLGLRHGDLGARSGPRLAASRSYAADDELGRLRRDAPQTQIGEGANDALLFALAREVLANFAPENVPAAWRAGSAST